MPGETPVKLLSVGPFGGVNSNNADIYVPENKAFDMLNLDSSRKRGAYTTIQGRTIFANVPANVIILAFTKFTVYPSTYVGSGAPGVGTVTPTEEDLYVALVADLNTAQFKVATFTAASFTMYPLSPAYSTTNFNLYAVVSGASIAKISDFVFMSFGRFIPVDFPVLYGTSTLPTMVKIDANLFVTYAQFAAPILTVGGAASGSGNLNATYLYFFTWQNDGFNNDSTQESSVSSTSSGDIVATNQEITLTITVSNYPGAQNLNIYRNSSASQSGVPQFIGAVDVTGNGVYTYVDNLADNAVTGQSLITHRDVPPNFYCIKAHKSRLWGFGYRGFTVPQISSSTPYAIPVGPSDLWYSNPGEPWGWDNTNQVFDMGRNQSGDDAVGMAEVGSLLLCFKEKTTWAVYGSTPADFIQEPLFSIGAVSQGGIVEAFGGVYWFSNSGQIWGYNGQLEYISEDIQAELYDLMEQFTGGFNTSNAYVCGYAYGRSVFFSFPNVTYEYRLDSKEWFKNGQTAQVAYYDTEGREVKTTSANVGAGYNVLALYQSEVDLGFPINSQYVSRITDSDAPEMAKEYTHLMILAPVQPAAKIQITVVVDPGPTQIEETITVDLGDLTKPKRKFVGLPKNKLIGCEVQIIISATSSQYTEIQKVVLYGVIRRVQIPNG